MSDSSAPTTAKARMFTDLIVWQEAHALVLFIYSITKHFPKEEIYGLTSQMRRAAVSISSNIAEGFNRQSKADKVHFYSMALSSLSEVQSQGMIARDVTYMAGEDFSVLFEKSIRVSKLLNGLMRSIKYPNT